MQNWDLKDYFVQVYRPTGKEADVSQRTERHLVLQLRAEDCQNALNARGHEPAGSALGTFLISLCRSPAQAWRQVL